jgi:peroxiredoxin/Spy/CpxP family protein refolding chaperone
MNKLVAFGTMILVLGMPGAVMAQDHGHAERQDHGHVPPHAGHRAHGHGAAPPMDHLRKRLNLTDEQTAKVKGVLDRLHKEMAPLTEGSRDEFESLRSRAWADIRATLSEKQRSEFDTLIHERHGPAGRPDHGRAEAPECEGPRRGEEVKDFAGADSAGKPFRLASLRATEESKGKIVVLTFWCTICHSCRAIDSDFDRMAAEYKGRGVQFLAVASNYMESAERVNELVEENELSFPVLMDSQSRIARYFDAEATTTTAVIDAEGRLRYYGRFPEAEAAVRNLLAGEEVAIPETPPMGCTILLESGSPEDADGKDHGNDHHDGARDNGHPGHDDHGHAKGRDHGHGGGG